MNEEKLQELLFDYLINNIPDKLDVLSTHTRILDVSDVVINSAITNSRTIEFEGTANAEVELAYGSARERNIDDDSVDLPTDYYDFTFKVIVEENQIIGEPEFEFDTEHFYT